VLLQKAAHFKQGKCTHTHDGGGCLACSGSCFHSQGRLFLLSHLKCMQPKQATIQFSRRCVQASARISQVSV